MKRERSLVDIAKNAIWTLRIIAKYNRLLVATSLVFLVFSSVVPFFRNRLFSQIIDNIVYQDSAGFQNVFLIFVGFLVFAQLINFLKSQFYRILDTKLQGQLRTLFIGKVSKLDYQHLESKEIGNLISKVDEEFGWRMRQTVSDADNIISNLLSLAAVTIIIIPRYPFLWFLIFLAQIPQYFIEKYWVQKDWALREANSEKNKLMWDLNYQLRQKNYIAELRVNNATPFLFDKYKKSFDFFTNNRVNLRLKQTPSEIILIIFSIFVYSICLYVLITDASRGVLTIGTFTFFFQTIQQTADFFRGIVFSSINITENSYHIGNFRRILSLRNIITGGDRLISSGKPPLIEFRNVSFKYPERKRYVYKNLNLTIKPGEEIAIVGQNGAGKSTLIKLLCHFYEPTTGDIFINGVNLREINLNSWYGHLAYLAQEFNTYWNLSLRDNIMIGNYKKNSDAAVSEALKKSDAGFVSHYSKGLDTLMSHRYGGEEPSWGQWQKIAIARTFYRDSSIIILDEPTASIDAISEFKIFSRIFKETKRKTLLIVSHRFSTVRNAKRIIVINKGEIVEQGTHEELVKLNGLYAKSFKLQAKGYN